MKSVSGIGLKEVQGVYSGPEGQLWELIMGEQIHIGGFTSSMDLAETAGIGAGMKGVDLCCCNGAGMRFLVRFRDMPQEQDEKFLTAAGFTVSSRAGFVWSLSGPLISLPRLLEDDRILFYEGASKARTM